LTVSPISIVPASGVSWPTSMRNRVVLPAPLGPMIPTIRAGGGEMRRAKPRPS
jgi:hypothetical protein